MEGGSSLGKSGSKWRFRRDIDKVGQSRDGHTRGLETYLKGGPGADTRHWNPGIGHSLSERSPFLDSWENSDLKAEGHGKAWETQTSDKEELSKPIRIPVPRFHLPRASIKNMILSFLHLLDTTTMEDCMEAPLKTKTRVTKGKKLKVAQLSDSLQSHTL